MLPRTPANGFYSAVPLLETGISLHQRNHAKRSEQRTGRKITGRREKEEKREAPSWSLQQLRGGRAFPTVGPGEMERVGGTPKQRRIIAALNDGDDGSSSSSSSDAAAAAAAGAELTAPASTAVGGETMASVNSRLLSSSYSAVASLTPMRHRRDNPAPSRVPASAAGAAAAAAAVNGRFSPPPSPPLRPAPTDIPYASGDSKYHHISRSNNGSTSNGDSGFLPASAPRASSARHKLDLLERRVRRLLWNSRWRRAAGGLRARCENRLSRLLRHRLGRRLVFAAAVLLVALLWFLVITAVAGPAGGTGGGGTGGTVGSANGGEIDGAGPRTPSYYRKISGEVGVGPSLDDPWVVRDIEIAAADWGLGGNGASDDEDSGVATGVALARGVEGTLVVGTGIPGGRREEWDGRVNSIVTGELQPVGARTRPKVDLLLVIFSGTSEVRVCSRACMRVCQG